MGDADGPSGSETSDRQDAGIRAGGYGLLGTVGNVVRLEFDGLATLTSRLQDFSERWVGALVRLPGSAFVLIVEYRELVIPVIPGTEPRKVNVPLT